MAKDYTVQQGECLSSIAFEHGFLWETLWNHPKNRELKQKRKDPNILQEGDVVHIPDLTPKEASRPTEAKHRFKLKGVPAKLKLRVLKPAKPEDHTTPGQGSAAPSGGSGSGTGSLPQAPRGSSKEHITEDPEPVTASRPDEPRANVPYVLEIDGHFTQGKTDSKGFIECGIPPNARRGRLIVEPGVPDELVVPLNLGHLDPVTELRGVKQRLANLGFGCEDQGNEPTPELEAALSAFQEQAGLEVTGEADEATRQKLKEVHGS